MGHGMPRGMSSCASEDNLINEPIEKVHPVRFESINEELIRRAAIKAKGGFRSFRY